MVTNMNNPANLSADEISVTKDDLWEKCLLYIKDRIQEQAFQTWFDGIIATSLNKEEITLQVPNQFHYEWLESKYRHLIDNALKEHAEHPLIVNYSVVISDKNIEEIPTLTSKEKPVPPGYQRKSQLNSRYIFENFIEGKSNQFAKAASFSVAETPGQTPYNPLLIYSNPGLGKTHLLQAIGNKIIMQNGNMRVVYLTSEKFMLDFISSIQKNRSTDFVNNYRNVDMLLLDDAQFFQSKEQTQEQFFHLFNDLFQKGKQIVLTTDCHPCELKGLKDRLVSRFQSGLIVDIQPPDLETRIAILMKRAENEKLDIPYDVIEFISLNGNGIAGTGRLIKKIMKHNSNTPVIWTGAPPPIRRESSSFDYLNSDDSFKRAYDKRNRRNEDVEGMLPSHWTFINPYDHIKYKEPQLIGLSRFESGYTCDSCDGIHLPSSVAEEYVSNIKGLLA